ncbi:MAG: GNAT family N-acetyltransferase [Bacteroidetes bacterium]|nr:GNAT family N-acetyltransferase [Bacteroidota bacterium]
MIRFIGHDEKLVTLMHNIFNDEALHEFLNPEYLNYRTKPQIRKWLKSKYSNPVEIWYVIKHKNLYVGYICYKWRKHYDEACEISTAIDKNYRGLNLGYESSKLLLDHLFHSKRFKYLVGYVHKGNKIAENNLKKLGLKKNNRLQKIVTKEFYDSDGSSSVYNLFSITT